MSYVVAPALGRIDVGLGFIEAGGEEVMCAVEVFLEILLLVLLPDHLCRVAIMLRETSMNEDWGGVVGEAGPMATKHGAVAGADLRSQHFAEDGVKIKYLGKVVRDPRTEQSSA